MKAISCMYLLVLLTLTSCSDNDDNAVIVPVANAGTLTVDGVTASINNAFTVKPYTGTNPNYNGRRFYLILTDGTVALQNNDIIYSDDIHHLVDFNLYTDQDVPGVVQNTTYPLYIPGNGFDMNNPYIDHTAINTNVMLQNGEYVSGEALDSDDMSAGQFILMQDNGIYRLTFSFSNQGHAVSGHYMGSLNELNYQF